MVNEGPIERIREFRAQRGLKKATLAKLAGLSANSLRGLDDPEWSPRYDTLRRLFVYIDAAEAAADQGVAA